METRTIVESGTKTKEDAYLRVYNARLGCLANNPTEEYLQALRQQAYGWIEEIDAALCKMAMQKAIEEENRAEEESED